jgi:chlorite dismutase
MRWFAPLFESCYTIAMDSHPYHNYLFFSVSADFYHIPQNEQEQKKEEFAAWLSAVNKLIVVSYSTLGFKANTTFMLWCRSKDPKDVQTFLPSLLRTALGKYLSITYTYFGIVRDSQYSGRAGKPEQVMQNYKERLPYFLLYPFTKTAEWHLLGFEERKAMMGEHIKIGVGHPNIRQCLLYSYGLDDQEFVVSYETNTLEEFQDLVMELRKTAGRKYTLVDTPTFTCVHRSFAELMEWL